jgi:hypothetical protein
MRTTELFLVGGGNADDLHVFGTVGSYQHGLDLDVAVAAADARWSIVDAVFIIIIHVGRNGTVVVVVGVNVVVVGTWQGRVVGKYILKRRNRGMDWFLSS